MRGTEQKEKKKKENYFHVCMSAHKCSAIPFVMVSSRLPIVTLRFFLLCSNRYDLSLYVLYEEGMGGWLQCSCV